MGDHDGAIDNRSEFASNEFINKMTEGVIIFLFTFGFLDGKLELALHFSHEKVVYHDVVGWIIKFILDSDQFEFAAHQLAVVKEVHRFQQTDEGAFGALKL